MSFSINSLASILQNSTSIKELTTLLKLVNIDVLTKTGSDTYLIKQNGAEVNAQSPKPLEVGSRYLATLLLKNDTVNIKELIKLPNLLAKLESVSSYFNTKDIISLLTSQNASKGMHQNVMELMSQSSSKEEFNAFSQLLLSLTQNVVTIPFRYENYFELFQMKKSYNSKKEKEQIDFYATLHYLGVVEGSITLVEDEVYLALKVAFKSVKEFLETKLKELSILHVSISVSEEITPFFEINETNILDINI